MCTTHCIKNASGDRRANCSVTDKTLVDVLSSPLAPSDTGNVGILRVTFRDAQEGSVVNSFGVTLASTSRPGSRTVAGSAATFVALRISLSCRRQRLRAWAGGWCAQFFEESWTSLMTCVCPETISRRQVVPVSLGSFARKPMRRCNSTKMSATRSIAGSEPSCALARRDDCAGEPCRSFSGLCHFGDVCPSECRVLSGSQMDQRGLVHTGLNTFSLCWTKVV